MTTGREIEVVCAVITDESGRVLACRRPDHKPPGGKWEFPGGKVDPGEPPQDALRREILEELGVTISVVSPLDPHRHEYGHMTIRLIPFRACLLDGSPDPREHSAIVWLGPDELDTLDWAGADLAIVEQLRQRAKALPVVE